MLRMLMKSIVVSVASAFISIQWAGAQTPQDEYFKNLRNEMVSKQIAQRGVRDARVLEAMRKVERHRFVPAPLQHLAYQDSPLPIGEDQTISQPYIVALMTELLQLEGREKVLEIGTGSGYQAAILAELAGDVYSIEILPTLAYRSEKLLGELGYTNIHIKRGDGYFGWPEAASFEAIIVTCAAEEIPRPLVEQLAEGGRMVIPQGDAYQKLKLLIKVNGKIEERDIIPVRFVPMKR